MQRVPTPLPHCCHARYKHSKPTLTCSSYLTKEGDVVLSDESLVQIASWAEDGLIQKPDSSAANGAKMIQTWSRRSGNEYLQHDRTAHNLIDAAGARGGAIICYHNDKYLDGNRGDRLKHLESSEIISQQYLQAAKLQNKKPRSLHSVTRFHVVNHATIGAIEFLGCSKEQNAQETNTYERGSKGFFTLLRTPNAKGVPYMLQDRYVLFGKRDIHSIRVFWNSEWDAWNMQFELRADAEADFGEPSTPMSKKARRQANKSLRSTG